MLNWLKMKPLITPKIELVEYNESADTWGIRKNYNNQKYKYLDITSYRVIDSSYKIRNETQLSWQFGEYVFEHSERFFVPSDICHPIYRRLKELYTPKTKSEPPKIKVLDTLNIEEL